MVFRESNREGDRHLRALGRQNQTVDEGVVGVVIGAQEKATLGTATGNHVVTTGHDLTRECPLVRDQRSRRGRRKRPRKHEFANQR
jgi:hypothetical protein